ncbi:hypothetical protein C9374_009777 [Naegleria lovaniensis]|uniref:C2H2-type domain-containing protein n=1 Tax=Naegleria lovaniensis TaxID=51637 RepID=A0AA88GQB2_NAELO|nr:uncharacterized protein C9374_005415 [Naegleria lovaniensis]XP_044548185.1 uncharacterized protein C9374_005086 [Naegleria lovaniensis]XP_044549399.1 uncharacterized protein C9374_004391 [Naegleria lovaniensis]XP_044553101.1 uncharacterized protein C9374_014509 [Naegleria lovaniensis]XP_044555094.1 uncharacterized protein C9374_009777 [Naegleria lovaniensis]KAG2382213.1 hypothetical protein C9374_005415 [Naegleria lovaniensis]KAG2382506.1 hypothetical protein C9374_005086 [Naegleria lovani
MVKRQTLLAPIKKQIPVDFYTSEENLDQYQLFMNRYCFLTMTRLQIIPSQKQAIHSAGARLYQQIKNHSELLDAITDVHSNLFTTSHEEFTVLSKSGREWLEQRTSKRGRVTKQDQLRKSIQDLQLQRSNILELKSSTQDEVLLAEYDKQLQELDFKTLDKKQAIAYLERKAAEQRIRRHNSSTNKIEKKRGRPRKASGMAQRLQAVVEGTGIASASERRRDSFVHTPMNGVDLVKEANAKLSEEGFRPYSRSGMLRYVVPRCKSSREGKRHDSEATVKLTKPSNDLTEEHVDLHATHSLNKYIKQLCCLLPEESTAISLDEKAKIPTKGAAVSTSTQIAMTSSSKVSLPDHDFPKGKENSITPNVAALLRAVVGGNNSLRWMVEKVYVRSSSNAEFLKTTSRDKDKMLCDLVFFLEKLKETGKLLPLFFCNTDNCVNVAPQNRKVQVRMFYVFICFDLDALIHTSFAAGGSKYNRVERCMAPLSKGLVGVIDLDDESFASKQQNHHSALIKLTNIFNQKGGKDVQAYYASVFQQDRIRDLPGWPSFASIDAFLEGKDITDLEEEKKVKAILFKLHTHSEHGNGLNIFCLRKCNDPSCCPPKRATKYWELMEKFDGFIPSPILDESNPGHYLSFEKRNNVEGVRMDEGFPSVKDDVKTCSLCDRRVHSDIDLTIHMKVVHPNKTQNQLDGSLDKDARVNQVEKTQLEGRSLSAQINSIERRAQEQPLRARAKRRFLNK